MPAPSSRKTVAGDPNVLKVAVVEDVAGSGGGTQYTEGDTDATITGTALLWEDAADTLSTVKAAKPLPVGDAGGSLTVDDGAGSLTVDGTVSLPAWTPYHLVSAATTNATSVKASAGQVGYVYASNVNAAPRYLKLYNKATAPTVGTDVPVATFIIPGNTAGGGFALAIPGGMAFSTGIAFALTTEATDVGSSAVALNDIVVNMGYL